ncbi:DNA polymerase III subunit delta [Poriferisphaera sp. WC338]|uniref:DNA polymerase III subunit delta n=1 Tax=Poriferisphaera sp. WC338 TaxID=3425129 RepID=UPI003D81A580
MAKKKASSKKTDFKPDADTRVLVLHGPDEMKKREHLAALRKVLDKVHGETETFTFDGKAATLADVFDEVRGYSLMMQYKIVIVDDADQFVKNHRDALERYADSPVDHATLVLRAGTWNRGNLDKKIAAIGGIIKCESASEADAVRWVIKKAQTSYNATLEQGAAQLLVDRLGADMLMLDTEVGKLSLMNELDENGHSTITQTLVERTTQKGSDEDAWTVQEVMLQGIIQGNMGPTLEMVHELVDLSGQPDVLVMYFVADLIRKLAVARSMKLGGVNDGTIAKELKLWGPRQQLFFKALGILAGKRGALAEIFDDILRQDKRSKSGFGDTVRNLECFCVRLSDR